MDQHTLIWELHNRAGALIDCEAWVENGGVHVLVKPADEPTRTQTFAECGEAVRWAVDLERTLVRRGLDQGDLSLTRRTRGTSPLPYHSSLTPARAAARASVRDAPSIEVTRLDVAQP